jgi:O-succinylbenzoate synthase
MLRWFPYRLALRAPLKLPGARVLFHRCGVLIQNQVTEGWGDAAPLPGYSTESVEDVLAILEQGRAAPALCPSLRFALECAEVPFAGPRCPVPVNALWMPERESLGALCRRLTDWVSPVIKIKPGADPDLKSIQELLKLRPDAKLRLDGNCQWDLAQLRTVIDQLPWEALDYIEEPLTNPVDYGLLDFDCPIALDESLLLPEGRELAEQPWVKALVLKPTLLGNTQDREPWVELAGRRGCQIIWSSAFESGAALWHLARLAEGGPAAGLDTGNVFADDLVSPRPLAVAGCISGEGRKLLVSYSQK